MRIVVTVKQVADPLLVPADLELDAATGRIAPPPGVAPVMNGYDAHALEEALRLRERLGGSVTAVGLGARPGARDALKRALAMGADAAVLLCDGAWQGADSAAVGQALAAAIRRIGACDLVLCGRQASDTDGGQVLYWIAHFLGLPAVSPVTRVQALSGRRLRLERLTDGGCQRLELELPVLLGVSSEANEPRLPALRGIMAAARARIPCWSAADLGIGAGAPKVVLRRLLVREGGGRAALVEGESGRARGAALAEKLHEAGLI